MQPRGPLILLMAAALLSSCSTTPRPAPAQRTGFIALKDFSHFTRMPGTTPDEMVLTSPELTPPVDWNELVVSWNTSAGAYLKVEARGVYPDHATRFYTLGLWSESPDHPRTSVNGQKDADGTVKTDTLVLKRPGARVQLRLTLGETEEPIRPGARPSPGAAMSSNPLLTVKSNTAGRQGAAAPGTGALRILTPAALKFIGLSFCDSRAPVTCAEPNRAAWGKSLPVPELRQGDYAGGGGWCSPVSLAMVLAYWSERLHRPELNRPVPEVAAAIYDDAYAGTGNWPFNTAYAGQFPGLRAYVTRLNNLSEVEDWIAAGVPVILSVSSYLTNDRHAGPDNGHLIVCTGFTEQGDMVANNPGVSVKRGQRARCIYPCAKVIAAWQKSHDTVYLIYPDTTRAPQNRFGDWSAN